MSERPDELEPIDPTLGRLFAAARNQPVASATVNRVLRGALVASAAAGAATVGAGTAAAAVGTTGAAAGAAGVSGSALTAGAGASAGAAATATAAAGVSVTTVAIAAAGIAGGAAVGIVAYREFAPAATPPAIVRAAPQEPQAPTPDMVEGPAIGATALVPAAAAATMVAPAPSLSLSPSPSPALSPSPSPSPAPSPAPSPSPSPSPSRTPRDAAVVATPAATDLAPATITPTPVEPSPHAPAPAAPPPLLGTPVAAGEAALIDEARAARRRGDVTAALAAVRRHRERFPRGGLAEEREVLAIELLVASGDHGGARSRIGLYRAQFPSGSLRGRVDAAAAVVGPR